MMVAELTRGKILFAIIVGLVFQFFQFFHNETRNMIASVHNVYSTIQTLSDGPTTIASDQEQPQQGQEQTGRSFSNFAEVTRDQWEAVLEQKQLEKLQSQQSSQLENFDPATFRYGQPAIPTKYTLPPPNITNQSTVVLVLSARKNFERRNAIRETWAKDNDNVFFVIGGPIPSDKEGMDMNNPLSTSSLLFLEQERFADMIDSIHPESYKSLPYKLHFGMRHIMRNMPNVNWIVKADDDVVVRVKLLQYFVLRKFNPNHPMVIGSVAVGAKPHRTGKWAEDPVYTAEEYPPWAFGSAGYVVSRPVAQYVADNEHYYYQGEDAGLGIWLDQSPLQVTWVDSPELRKDEGCEDKLYIIGHDLNTDAIRNCFNKIGDTVPHRDHIVAFSAGRKDQFPGRIRNVS